MAGIGDHNLYRIATFNEQCGDINLSHHGLLQRLGGVVDEIRDCSLHRVRIGEYYRQIRREVCLNCDSVEASAEQLQSAFNNRIDLAGSRLCSRKTRERGEFIYELTNGFDRIRDGSGAAVHHCDRILIRRSAAFQMATNAVG